MADETPLIDIVLQSSVESIRSNTSYQSLAKFVLTNNHEDTIYFGGNPDELAEFLDPSVLLNGAEGMNKDLQILFVGGPKNAQYDLAGRIGHLEPNESCVIDIRLINAPGVTGSFNLNVGEGQITLNEGLVDLEGAFPFEVDITIQNPA